MNKISKKIAITLTFILLMAVSVSASASIGSTSTAETDSYILTISDIIELQDLEAPRRAEEDYISFYTLSHLRHGGYLCPTN